MSPTSYFAKPICSKTFFGNIKYGNPPSFKDWGGIPSLLRIAKWLLTEKDDSKIPNKTEVAKALPVLTPKFDSKSNLSATWLGHATVFVQLEGLNLITDPVFSARASPFKFSGPKRYVRPPCVIENLPPIDVGVISHNHYDHLDCNAVMRISDRNPKMKWLVPLGLKKFVGSKAKNVEVIEKNWGETYDFKKNGKSFTVLCVPAQHWSQRGALDRCKTLWCGWAIMGQTHKFYYSGDTGLCEEEFKKLGDKYGPFQLAAIPIGCYCPRWFMRSQHIDPEEAVLIHKYVKAENTIGIHWGTYEMGSNEPYLEPVKLFEEAAQKHGFDIKKVFTIGHGKTWIYES